MLEVRRLRLLRELAHRGTIAAVAEALAYTPSAVSQQLSALEDEAGVELLERSGRRVTLTPAARALVRHTDSILERLERAEAELAEARHGASGPLRIGTFPTAAQAIVPAALKALGVDCPALEPFVSEIDPAQVADALRVGALDVALIHEYDFVPAAALPGLATEPLFSEAMYLAWARGRAARRESIADWKDSPWIVATPGTLCHAMTVRACQAAGFEPQVRHRVDEYATVLALVAAGQGVSLVPELATAHLPRGVSLTPMPMSRRTRVAYRRGAEAHPAIVAVIRALRRAIPPKLAEPRQKGP